jgi:membrane protease YdiL (CAAX protease family)
MEGLMMMLIKFFQNKHGELRASASIIAVLAAMQTVTVAVSQLIILVNSMYLHLDSGGQFLLTMPIAQVVGLAAICLVFKLLYKRPLRKMGLSSKRCIPGFLQGSLFGATAMTICVSAFVLSGLGSLDSFDFSRVANPLFLYWLAAFILVGLVEETFARGYLMTAMKTMRSKYAIAGISSLIFAVMHFGTPAYGLYPLLNLFLLGLVFACLFIKTGSLWMSIGCHFTWNFFQGSIFGLEVSGTSSYSLGAFSFTGPELLTGGGYGAEGGLVCTAIAVLMLIFIHFCVGEKDPVWTVDGDLPLVRTPKKASVKSVKTLSSVEFPEDSFNLIE